MARAKFTTTFLEKVPMSGDLASFRFAKPEGFEYIAGQWFVLSIPSPSGTLAKPFTYSSSPTEPFLMMTTRLSGSDYKNALDALQPGAEVGMEGPGGRFTLDPARDRVAFLAGGVGVTPIRSMLRFLADSPGAARPQLVAFYGNLDEAHIPFAEEFVEFEQKLGLRTVHVLMQPSEAWTGHKGFITADVLKAELDDPGAWTFYTSGPPPMIEAMKKVLDTCDVPAGNQIFEYFGAPAK